MHQFEIADGGLKQVTSPQACPEVRTEDQRATRWGSTASLLDAERESRDAERESGDKSIYVDKYNRRLIIWRIIIRAIPELVYPDVSESVIPTEAKRSGGILCLPLSSYGKATTRFLDSRRQASLARNDVHLLGYSISGTALGGNPAFSKFIHSVRSRAAHRGEIVSKFCVLVQKLDADPAGGGQDSSRCSSLSL